MFSLCTGVNALEETKSIYHIRVKPNDYNQILIPSNPNEEESDFGDNLRPLRCIHFFSCSDPCARMDSKIVKHALQVVDKNAIQKNDDNEYELLNNRITKMEKTLTTILDKLNDLSTN